MKTKSLFGDKPKFLSAALSSLLMILFQTTHTAQAGMIGALTPSSIASNAVFAGGIAVLVAGLGLMTSRIGFSRLFHAPRETGRRNLGKLSGQTSSRSYPG